MNNLKFQLLKAFYTVKFLRTKLKRKTRMFFITLDYEQKELIIFLDVWYYLEDSPIDNWSTYVYNRKKHKWEQIA